MKNHNINRDDGVVVDQVLDESIWFALADPTRRKILDLLRVESKITNELCKHFSTTRFAVMKHLRILESSGLIVVEKRGKTRVNHLNPVPIQAIYRRWIQPFERIPADRLIRLKLLVEKGEVAHE